ncbi:MAG: hypothetical protein M1831_000947 [Alyxoria varia]|nr:MAG: hypothetical protein M1831_000947 [Alyxoria varia]
MNPYEPVPTLPKGIPSAHTAIATPAPRAPLTTIQTPTIPPHADEVLVRVEYACSGLPDLHQADGGMLISSYPEVLGDALAGSVVSVGWAVTHVQPGDKVFGFAWRLRKEKAQQVYATVPAWLMGKVPEGMDLADAVTVPTNFVTVFNVGVRVLGLEMPWPIGEQFVKANKAGEKGNGTILVWGASSSVGMYTVQVLKRYGYGRIIATASSKHNAALREMGAEQVFDYRDDEVTNKLLSAGRQVSGSKEGPAIEYIVDCIGSVEGTLKPLSKVAEKGTKVAVMMPIIVKDAAEGEGGEPVYTRDVGKAVDWKEGVAATGVRTHFYWMNELFKHKLQPEIMPTMLAEGTVKPNPKRVIEGKNMLERAQKSLDILRRKEVSGERLVWRIEDDE